MKYDLYTELSNLYKDSIPLKLTKEEIDTISQEIPLTAGNIIRKSAKLKKEIPNTNYTITFEKYHYEIIKFISNNNNNFVFVNRNPKTLTFNLWGLLEDKLGGCYYLETIEEGILIKHYQHDSFKALNNIYKFNISIENAKSHFHIHGIIPDAEYLIPYPKTLKEYIQIIKKLITEEHLYCEEQVYNQQKENPKKKIK